MTLGIRKLIVTGLVAGVFLLAHFLLAAGWLEEKGVTDLFLCGACRTCATCTPVAALCSKGVTANPGFSRAYELEVYTAHSPEVAGVRYDSTSTQ
jgi:hypothetical protein